MIITEEKLSEADIKAIEVVRRQWEPYKEYLETLDGGTRNSLLASSLRWRLLNQEFE